jgi:predicted membrane protein
MPGYEEYPKLGHRKYFGLRTQSILTRVLAVIVGGALLVGAVAISFVLFAVALAGILVFGVYVWWKTRDLRRQIKQSLSTRGNVIEGEVIRDVTPDRKTGDQPGDSGR